MLLNHARPSVLAGNPATAGFALVLAGDIFMTIPLVITGQNLAFLLCHYGIVSFHIFRFTILSIVHGRRVILLRDNPFDIAFEQRFVGLYTISMKIMCIYLL
jgi:hypothetical protein